MRHIFDTRSKPGRLITIMRVRILASDRGYQIRGRRRQSFKPNGIVFRRIAELQRPPSWVVCITNTGWRKLPHDDNAFKHSKTSESIFCGAQAKEASCTKLRLRRYDELGRIVSRSIINGIAATQTYELGRTFRNPSGSIDLYSSSEAGRTSTI